MVSALRNTSGSTTALPQVEHRAALSSAGSEPASRRKSRWLVAPIAAPSAAGCWWMISAPIAACTVTGTSCSMRREQDRRLAAGQRRPRGERAGQSFAHALARVAPRRAMAAFISAPGLLRHAEAAVRQPALDVFAGPAERGQLEVVDRRRAVERHVGDDAALDQRRGCSGPSPTLITCPPTSSTTPRPAAGRGGDARR